MAIVNQGFEYEGTGLRAGMNSHAEGSQTQASGDASHAEGFQTVSSGNYSHVEGIVGTASGSSSHAEGYGTTASAIGAHAEGRNANASAPYSHAGGYGARAWRHTQWARSTCSNGLITPMSYAQTGIINLGGFASNGTVTALMSDGGTTASQNSANPNVFVVPYKSTIVFRFLWTAHRTDAASTNMSSAGEAVGAVSRDSTGNAYFCGTPTQTAFVATTALATLSFSINTGDAANNYMQVTFTPASSYQVVVTGTLLFHEQVTTTY